MSATDLTVVYMQGTPFETWALKAVSLSIEAGEILGLVGATGSGKSTFLQAVAGLIETAGPVIRYGPSIDPARLYATVGMVFQMPEDQLFERTVVEDVGFGPRQLGWDKTRLDSSVQKALERVGLDPRVYGPRSPTTLSGGEKRRVAIAGILSMEPALLLLDEPTAGLDAHGQKQLLRVIKGLNKEGTTVVIVTHDLELLVGLASRVAVFDRGTVRSVGPTAQILGQTDLLRSVGLRAPLTAELLAALAGRGVPVRTGLLDVPETVEAIREAFKAWQGPRKGR
ncbi:MAG: ATP-binding cassette domain-containing protein [Candidatus Riflebacteria bacterium]|nr:ATP-binding cassette domain-containing protein [Candidatus Riflebacteria bacterium]